MDNKQLHLRLPRDDAETLDDLAGGILSRQQVATMLLSAACAAVRHNGMRIGFPPHFTVGVHDTDTTRILKLNDPSAVPKVKK